MNIVLIDPWGINNTSEYLNGLISGLGSICNLTVFTNCYFEKKVDSKAKINYIFFRKSEKLKRNMIRKIIRFFEYINGYKKIFKFLKKNPDCIIHINWLLSYKVDYIFLKKLKKLNFKIVYTAHNVIPHVNGEKKLNDLRKIYSCVDRIILHGQNVLEEFNKYFNDLSQKVYIQFHGSNLFPNINYNSNLVDIKIKTKLSKYDRVYVAFGRIFYNKGTDRLLDIWKDEFDDILLVIAGSVDSNYRDFINKSKEIIKDNILILNGFIDDNTLNYIIANSNLILLPYRHASMSGVIFTASDFCKPVLTTNVGAISEYIISNENGFICDNNLDSIKEKLNFISKLSSLELNKIGFDFHHYICSNYSWENICKKIKNDIYNELSENKENGN